MCIPIHTSVRISQHTDLIYMNQFHPCKDLNMECIIYHHPIIHMNWIIIISIIIILTTITIIIIISIIMGLHHGKMMLMHMQDKTYRLLRLLHPPPPIYWRLMN